MLDVDPSRSASRDLQEYLDGFRSGDPRLLEQVVHDDSAHAQQRRRGKSAVYHTLLEQVLHRDPEQAPARGLRRTINTAVPAACRLGLDSYYGLRKLAGVEAGRDHILPDFVIIGFPKCGTTSLFDWICEHPFVKSPLGRDGQPIKELYYFDYNYPRHDAWYRQFFATQRERDAFTAAHGRPFLTGEATVSTLTHAWAPERVAKLLPDAKLIVNMRNPVDRAYSAFHQSRRRSLERAETFEEALALEAERLPPLEARARLDPHYNPRQPPPLAYWSYLQRSRYAQHLERWLSLFPREQFLFVEFEEMTADPQATLDVVYDFLGLESHRLADFRKLNRGEYTSMNPETRAHLVEYFRPHNAAVRALTGLECAWDR